MILMHLWTIWAVLSPHLDIGPKGWVAFIQPPHIAAGFGWVSGHLVTWWEVA